ncbi:MAG: DNA topoisomerase IV subunit A, partial [Spirochaeta sp.]
MPYADTLFKHNFLHYASYVIKERAIPHVDDGLKPVQRRIMHSLFEVDDGKFHKVANIVGHCMKYHPHGDASIYEALVNISNRDILIDKQGNFGNIITGDQASAARYIECRATPFGKAILYNPALTVFEPSYDGRNKEPVVFPAKIPLILVQGAEGIAVGMSTKILPHNLGEVVRAVQARLQGERIELYPDFAGGGLIDVSDYQDGHGKVLTRALLDTTDPKRIVIREIPFGTTTESLIASIENAARKGKLKIASIDDYTGEQVEIEIKLPKGVYTKDLVDQLFAYTDCEYSISVNLLVIHEGKPVSMTVQEIIEHHARRLVHILTEELKNEQRNLLDQLHARTLEQIFVEERIYKRIETEKTQQGVIATVKKGFEPFHAQIKREVTTEDVERLLRIPIRRISLYDIQKAKHEMQQIRDRLKEIAGHLKSITAYAVGYLEDLLKKAPVDLKRRTRITSFDKIEA